MVSIRIIRKDGCNLLLWLLGIATLLFSGYSQIFGQCTIVASASSVCGGETVRLTLSSPVAEAVYSWDFDGDGQPDADGREASFVAPSFTSSDQNITIRIYSDGDLCGSKVLTVRKVPDPSIGIPATLAGAALNGNVISVCNAGDKAFLLEIVNRSATRSDNRTYHIDWGDGSPVLNLGGGDFNGKLTHPYSGRGYQPLTVTVTGSNGCASEGRYQYFNGSNPALTLGSPGNTTGLCAPTDLTFPISGIANNPPGTAYQISVNGKRQLTYNQNDVPIQFTLNFNESSCDKVTSTGKYRNAFDVEVVAVNPCGSTTSTVEPIELSGTPEPRLQVTAPPRPCPGEPFRFRNATVNIAEVRSGGASSCTKTLEPDWEITPGVEGVDWRLTQGSLFGDQEIRVAFLQPGTYSVRMLVKSSACGLKATKETVTILEPPVARAAARLRDNDSCAGEVVHLENRSAGHQLQYRWQVSGSNWRFIEGTNESSKEPVLRLDGAGKYDIRLTASNTCQEDFWDTTIVLNGPPQVSFDDLPDACERAVLVFNNENVRIESGAQPVTFIQWDFPGAVPSSFTDKHPQGVTYGSPGTYGVVLRAANTCGEAVYSDTFRVVAPTPVTMPVDRTLCSNDAPVLLSAAPVGGSWQGKGLTASGRFDPAVAGPGVHELTYTFGTSTCRSQGTMKVVVHALPAIDAGADLAICGNGDPVVLTANPAGGAWRLSGGVLREENIFDPRDNNPGSYPAIYAFTDGNGCVSSDQRMITVRQPPVVTAEDLNLCNVPGAVSLPAAQPAGGRWEGPGLVGADQFDPALAGGTGEYVLTYTFTNAAGCAGTADAHIRVAEPGVVEAGPDLSICAGATLLDLNQQASPPGGQWREARLGIIHNGLFNPAAAGPGVYQFSYSLGTGNCRVEDQRTVEVPALPAIDLSANPSSTCISTDSVVLRAFPAGGGWKVSAGGLLSENVFFPERSGAGRYIFTYSLEDDNGCPIASSMELIVHDLPEVRVADATFCAIPGLVDLPAAQPTGGRWTGPGVQGNRFDPLAAGGLGEYRLTYTFSDNEGCADSVVASITVTAPLTVEAGPADTLCLDSGPVKLSGFFPEGGRWTGPGIRDERAGIVDLQRAGGGIHTYRYTIGAGNCEVHDMTTLTIIDLTATTAGAEQAVCADAKELRLGGASPASGTWSGPGIVDSIAGIFNPEATGPGHFEVTYRLVDGSSGCATAAAKSIRVHELPDARFVLPPEVCLGEDIHFKNQSVNTVRSQWDFGDGASGQETSPAHRFREAGSYLVGLTATSQFGCSDFFSDTLVVEVPPDAAFGVNIQEGCAPLAVTFDNRSTGSQVSYYWDFGDGRILEEREPGTVIFDQGHGDTTYTVTLTASNHCAERQHRQVITVFPKPIADFGIPTDNSCTPMTVTFANNSAGNAGAFYWDLGNGRESKDSIPSAQVYTTDSLPSEYTITLVAANYCGTDTARRTVVVRPVEVEAFFHVPSRQGCQPFETVFTNYSTPGAFVSWDFGDSYTSTSSSPVHTFKSAGTFTVVQRVSNGCGYDSAVVVIEVLPAPVVDFLAPDRVCQQEEFTLDNLSVNTVGHHWAFGDGDSSAFLTPVHRYLSPGKFSINLKAFSAGTGCPASASRQIEVLPLPVATANAALTEGCVPLTVAFESLSESGAFFTWNFGDGNSGVGGRPAHTFTQAGSYSVELAARDENGCSSDTARLAIQVHPAPSAAFSFERDRLCGMPVELSFHNQSEGAKGYRWEFGDQGQSTANNPIFTFLDTGLHQVRLTAVNEFGCERSAVDQIKIYPIPQARFEALPGEGCQPLPVTFVDRSRNANGYSWLFGDGGKGAGVIVEHTYWSVGRYPVTLVASYDELCFDTLILATAVEVLPAPRASFRVEEDLDSLPAGIFNFINTSEDAVGYFWDFGDGNTSVQADPRHRYYHNGARAVTLQAVGANGCLHDTTQLIEPTFFSGLFVPNALAPEGGTGEARYFLPKGVGLSEYRLEIFSAFGDLLWTTDKLEAGRPVEGWDGTRQGERLPQDVYVWKIFARFEDGTVWRGQQGPDGKRRTLGSVLLVR